MKKNNFSGELYQREFEQCFTSKEVFEEIEKALDLHLSYSILVHSMLKGTLQIFCGYTRGRAKYDLQSTVK